MAFVGVLRPQTEPELAVALAILESRGIRVHVHGQYFGSLLPGVQIQFYNTRTIMVPQERADEALDALSDVFLKVGASCGQPPMRVCDRVRVVLEAVLFGWFVSGTRRSK